MLNRIFIFLRHLAMVTGYYRKGNVFIGKNLHAEPEVLFYTDETGLIVLGDNVFIGSNCNLCATNGAQIIIGNAVNILSGTEIAVRGEVKKAGGVYIGNATSIHRNNRIDISGKVYIGDNVSTGEGCFMHTHIHNYDKPGLIWDQGITTGNVRIERGCWIGVNVQIMPGVTIGEGTIIGAGAIVTKDIDPYVVAGGIPAKKIKDRIQV